MYQVLGQQIQAPIFLAANKIRAQIFLAQTQELLPLAKQINLLASVLALLPELIYLDSHNRMHSKLLRLVKRALPQAQISLVQVQVNYSRRHTVHLAVVEETLGWLLYMTENRLK